MGCDVHCYLEYRTKNPQSDYQKYWSSFGGRINPGRDYLLFARIAGVRGPKDMAVVQPRGVPSDMGWRAEGDYWMYIVEDEKDLAESGYCLRSKAEEWVKGWGCVYKDYQDEQGRPKWVSHPDWHTHTWLTPDEWEKAITLEEELHEKAGPCYYAMLAAMRSFEQQEYEARVVLWFDN